LPESQLDRFLMRLSIGYPNRAAELSILDTNGANDVLDTLQAVLTSADVTTLADAVRTVHLAPALKAYLVDLSEASRRHAGLALGLSPRATLQLAKACRAYAATCGRTYATPDDVKAVAGFVLPHRLMIRPDASARGLTDTMAVDEILASVPVPTGR
jgi:MoxR-like ATPase